MSNGSCNGVLQTNSDQGKPSPDPSNADVGETVEKLQVCIPWILHKSLPKNILSPNIELWFYPRVQPYMPPVKGRRAYTATMWAIRQTFPLFFFPISGTKLLIEHELMTTIVEDKLWSYEAQWSIIAPCYSDGHTDSKTGTQSDSNTTTNTHSDMSQVKITDVSGIFLFDINAKGLVVRHTVEAVKESQDPERDGSSLLQRWLLGRQQKSWSMNSWHWKD